MSGRWLDVREAMGFDERGRRKRAERLVSAAADAWRARARTLGSSRDAYTAAISERTDGPDGGRAVLTGTVPNIVEQGMGPGGVGTEGPYDVRRWVFRPGTKAKRAKAGHRFANVPVATGADGRPVFRTVSEAGKPWIHPGVRARRLARQVQESDLATIAREVR